MGFWQAADTVLFKKYAQFSGRASRAEFWWFQFFCLLVFVCLGMIGLGVFLFLSQDYERAFYSGTLKLAYNFCVLPMLLFWIAIFLPGLAVTVRRLHDVNLSGWWSLLRITEPLHFALAVFLVLASVSDACFDIPVMLHEFMLLVNIVFLAFAFIPVTIRRGTKGANRFGADPLQ